MKGVPGEFDSVRGREMQKRSVASRNANKERKKALQDILREELAKPISKDSKVTKGEWLVMRMLQNLKDDIKPADVRMLQKILGEAVLKVETTSSKPSDAFLDMINGNDNSEV